MYFHFKKLQKMMTFFAQTEPSQIFFHDRRFALFVDNDLQVEPVPTGTTE